MILISSVDPNFLPLPPPKKATSFFLAHDFTDGSLKSCGISSPPSVLAWKDGFVKGAMIWVQTGLHLTPKIELYRITTLLLYKIGQKKTTCFRFLFS